MKTVTVVARIEFKADSKKVCYIVKSSDGIKQYTTCLYNGKACSCSCPATNGKCYHREQVTKLEALRTARKASEQVLVAMDVEVQQHIVSEVEKGKSATYEQGLRKLNASLAKRATTTTSTTKREHAPLNESGRTFALPTRR